MSRLFVSVVSVFVALTFASPVLANDEGFSSDDSSQTTQQPSKGHSGKKSGAKKKVKKRRKSRRGA